MSENIFADAEISILECNFCFLFIQRDGTQKIYHESIYIYTEKPIENAQMYSHMIFQYHLILIVS